MNPVNDLHCALAHAAYQGFPEYEYQDRDWSSKDRDARITKKTHHTEYNITVIGMFPQTWGSTALGFGGLGGQAITTAYTIVMESEINGNACVYFGGRFAYRIDRPNEQFYKDMHECQMEKVSAAKARYERTI